MKHLQNEVQGEEKSERPCLKIQSQKVRDGQIQLQKHVAIF